MTSTIDTDSPKMPLEPGSRTRLIEARLRQNVGDVVPLVESRLPSFVFEHLMEGDAGHLHRAHNLRDLPIESRRRLSGPMVSLVKRMLMRLLHPLLEVQTTWNAANARVVTLLLRQVAAQARSIELLEQQVAELNEKLDR
jgi:hypothetical protein